MENIFDFKLLISRCEETHQLTRTTAARATNKALVIRNFLLGRYIVEFEQNGSNRAQYGESLLQELSNALKTSIGRGFSVDNLESMRRFYTAYSANILPIKSETPSRILKNQISETLSRISSVDLSDWKNPTAQQITRLQSELNLLSWSHYVTLLSVTNPDERSFYEIESAANDWSLRELKRQINSSLFERLALSRDKDQVKTLAQEGQIVEQAADLIKNPYVLEFLGIDERASYSESDRMPSKLIIDKGQLIMTLNQPYIRPTLSDESFEISQTVSAEFTRAKAVACSFSKRSVTTCRAPAVAVRFSHRPLVACSFGTMPLQINFYTTASLERGVWGGENQIFERFMVDSPINNSPASPAGPFIMPLGARAAVVIIPTNLDQGTAVACGSSKRSVAKRRSPAVAVRSSHRSSVACGAQIPHPFDRPTSEAESRRSTTEDSSAVQSQGTHVINPRLNQNQAAPPTRKRRSTMSSAAHFPLSTLNSQFPAPAGQMGFVPSKLIMDKGELIMDKGELIMTLYPHLNVGASFMTPAEHQPTTRRASQVKPLRQAVACSFPVRRSPTGAGGSKRPVSKRQRKEAHA